MSLVNIVVIIVGLCLSISKRTRPLTIAVAAVWLLKEAGISFFADHDNTRAIGALIITGGLAGNAYKNRKKYIADITTSK